MRQLIVARQNNGFSLCWPEATTQKKNAVGLGRDCDCDCCCWGLGSGSHQKRVACSVCNVPLLNAKISVYAGLPQQRQRRRRRLRRRRKPAPTLCANLSSTYVFVVFFLVCCCFYKYFCLKLYLSLLLCLCLSLTWYLQIFLQFLAFFLCVACQLYANFCFQVEKRRPRFVGMESQRRRD